MKRALPVLLLLLVVVPLQAQLRWGVRAGIAEGEPLIGGELVYPIWDDFVINPNIEYTPELFSVNGDVHYDFDLPNKVSFWIGAGLAFLSPDEGDHGGGVNILGGVGIEKGRFYPYAQAKMTASGEAGDYGSVVVGVRF